MTPTTSNPVPPITEDDIAHYLGNTPDFFERHAEVLASVQLTSPHGTRAVSLQERQAEMLRDKIKGLEHRVMDMVRHSGENAGIADKLHHWAADLLQEADAAALPARVADGIASRFGVPQVALKLWGVASAHAHLAAAHGASEDARTFASSLAAPFCGPNRQLEPTTWLADAAAAQSIALLPLRVPAAAGDAAAAPAPAFGLLVLASGDVQRFEAGMGTDFLERMAALAGAALSRLLPA